MEDTAGFEARVYALVAAIPPGRVASYGQLALLAGGPGRARLAGRALARVPQGLPCHRVVNAAGRTVPGWEEQPALLRREGVRFRQSGAVDMRSCRWRPY